MKQSTTYRVLVLAAALAGCGSTVVTGAPPGATRSTGADGATGADASWPEDAPLPIDGTALDPGVVDAGGGGAGVVDVGRVTPAGDAGFCTVQGVTCPVGVACRINACRNCLCDSDGGETMCGEGASCGLGGPVSPCPPQAARGVGDCGRVFGYAWAGTRCVAVAGCSCEGSDCMWIPHDFLGCERNQLFCPR